MNERRFEIRDALIDIIEALPKRTIAPTREEWKLWIQDLPRPAPDLSDVDEWLDLVERWLEHGPWMRGK